MTLEAIRSRSVGALRGMLAVLVLTAWPVSAGAIPADSYSGKWYLELPPGPPEIVEISDVDGAVTFTFHGAQFHGSSLNDPESALRATAAGTPSNACGSLLTALRFGDSLYGAVVDLGDVRPPFFCVLPGPGDSPRYFTGHRCSCLDGNTTAGDGCDPSCRVEECFECTGDPSACAPAADGAACDDGSSCTAGETCSSGACTGGGPAACLEVAGNWAFRFVSPFLEEDGFPPAVAPAFVTQVDDFVEIRFSPSSPAVFAGPIDLDAGTFTLRKSPLPHVAPCGADTLQGQFGRDGVSLFALQNTHLSGFRCLSFPSEVTGSRCGTGTLAEPKQCDDGNLTPGDGCDANCFVEPCFTCTGEPSVCSASEDATPCDDGSACTTGDACEQGSCVGSAAMDCGPCLACGPSGQCEAAPLDDCQQPAGSQHTRFMLTNRSGNEIAWSWQGAGTSPAVRNSGERALQQDYTLCVYDESGAQPKLLFRATAPASGWKSIHGRGSSYRNPEATPEGIRSLRMGWGRRGSARATLRGKGPLLSDRLYGFPDLPLPFPLRTQLQGEDGTCFEAVFGAPRTAGRVGVESLLLTPAP